MRKHREIYFLTFHILIVIANWAPPGVDVRVIAASKAIELLVCTKPTQRLL